MKVILTVPLLLLEALHVVVMSKPVNCQFWIVYVAGPGTVAV